MRSQDKFASTPFVIKHRMSDRYANLVSGHFLVMYRTTLFSLYKVEKNVTKCWSYKPNLAQTESVIKKVVAFLSTGILVWEKNVLERHCIHLRSYQNGLIFATKLSYLEVEDSKTDSKLKLNDIVGGPTNKVIIDITTVLGTGILDIVDYRSGSLLKRLEHDHNPMHGWVVHCRSVCPPRYVKSLGIVPFLQYKLVVDLTHQQLVQKEHEEDPPWWPLHVEFTAFNTSSICYTDNNDANVIKVVRAINAPRR